MKDPLALSLVLGSIAFLLSGIPLLGLVDTTSNEVRWGPYTLTSTRNWYRHRLLVDGVLLATVDSSAVARGVVQDPLLGAVAVEVRPVSGGGVAFFARDRWVGGKSAEGVEGEPTPFPEPDDPRWVAAETLLVTERQSRSPEVRATALAIRRTLFEALVALDDVRAKRTHLLASTHPSASDGLAFLEEAASTWDKAVARQLEMLHELHTLAIRVDESDSIQDASARMRAEREVHELAAHHHAARQRQ